MTDKVFNVLFLCTGNSARSIFAECILNRLGRGKFKGYSAGSHPKGEVHPYALAELTRNHYDTNGLRSKEMAEFEGAGAPQMDFVFTVCDQAAAEVCPVWPGHPMTAHWGVEDPAAAKGNDRLKKAAFAKAFRELRNRIALFVDLPLESLSKTQIKEKLVEIGRIALADPAENRGGQ